MTSRERVLTTFHHAEPDRVPIDYLANPGIDARLKKHFGLCETDDEGLRQVLGVDFLEVAAPYIGPKLHPDIPGRKIDLWGIRTRWIEHGTGGYWDYCDFPLQDADEEQVAAWPMPSPDDFDYEALVQQCRDMRQYCLMVGNPGLADMINTTSMIRTMDRVLMDLMVDDSACLLFMDRKNALQLEVVRRSLEAAKGMIDVLWLGEDLGTQAGPMVSLDLFRKHLRPRHQVFVDLGKEFDIPVMIHSCGSSSWAFDDFIEMGISVIDTLQPEAANMAPSYLKDRYGRALAFHGCMSTAGVIVTGSSEEAVRGARDLLEVMMPGGGYAFSPTHLLQDNTPTENVVAVYEAVHRYGKYGGRR
ncbi:MAG: methylcobalamin:coenzyme methyltransferase [Bacteroidetes bacterium]|nr:methylcobalamin:coenzyme methyltransferase [Bacteroidota bacterium]